MTLCGKDMRGLTGECKCLEYRATNKQMPSAHNTNKFKKKLLQQNLSALSTATFHSLHPSSEFLTPAVKNYRLTPIDLDDVRPFDYVSLIPRRR